MDFIINMSNDELASYIARKYDSVDGHERDLPASERKEYDFAVKELQRRVGIDEAERMIDNA